MRPIENGPGWAACVKFDWAKRVGRRMPQPVVVQVSWRQVLTASGEPTRPMMVFSLSNDDGDPLRSWSVPTQIGHRPSPSTSNLARHRIKVPSVHIPDYYDDYEISMTAVPVSQPRGGTIVMGERQAQPHRAQEQSNRTISQRGLVDRGDQQSPICSLAKPACPKLNPSDAPPPRLSVPSLVGPIHRS